jgi:type IV pilus assembly protein PilY1
MKKVIRKTTGTVLGLTLALVSGAPILADDTELLLVAPPDPNELKPNVMFILDTSGSMNTEQLTGEPYDPSKNYSTFGDCDEDKLYYSDDSSRPVCDTTTRYLDKSAWHCAASAVQIADVGTYTGVLVQYRGADDDLDGVIDGNAWRELEPGNSSDDVECEKDSGVHGHSVLASTIDTYAASGTDAEPWTSDPSNEIAWDSSGRNVEYKVWDGKYLNYRKDPATKILSRSAILKEATKTVLNSVNAMNVGLMRFNNTEGGVIIRAPIDLDANRAAILTDIDNLDADGFTPLSEALFETALYWQGLPAYYGENITQHTTDPLAFSSTDPTNIYDRPDMLSCSKNFNVLISDGLPTRDTDTPGLLGRGVLHHPRWPYRLYGHR